MSIATDPGVDAELGALLVDVVDGVDMAIERDGGAPDFAAVVALAHRLDPDRVNAEAVAEAAALAPVVPLSHGRRRLRTRDDPELSAIVDEVRAHVEQRIAAGPSPAARIVVAAPRVRSRYVWAGVLAAAAALVLVVLGATRATEILGDDTAELPDAAQHEQATDPLETSRARVIDEATPPTTTPGESDSRVEPTPVVEEATPEASGDATPAPRARSKRKPVATPDAAPPPATPTLEDELAALDREAHAAWRAGDRATAELKFRRIVELAGKRRIADLAYGDLFTLARQGGKSGSETALWREYLARFPAGRFADDARAGLCRRATGDDARACWQDYLRDFPEGSFRRQAERALEEPRP